MKSVDSLLTILSFVLLSLHSPTSTSASQLLRSHLLLLFFSFFSQTCVLCCRSIGAFKPTTNEDEWAHVLCASFIPGISFGDYSKLEPVLGVKKCVKEREKMVSEPSPTFSSRLKTKLIPPPRVLGFSPVPFLQRCSICHQKGGAPIQCASKKCCKPFHVSCARDKGLLESMAQEGPTLLPDFERGAMPRVWCETHRPVSPSSRYSSFLDVFLCHSRERANRVADFSFFLSGRFLTANHRRQLRSETSQGRGQRQSSFRLRSSEAKLERFSSSDEIGSEFSLFFDDASNLFSLLLVSSSKTLY